MRLREEEKWREGLYICPYMGVGDNILFFFSSLGAFNGLILSVYFFFFAAKKHLSNYLLSALLFVLSIRIGKSVVYFFDRSLPLVYLQIGLTACFFIGPFLYFYIKSEVRQIRSMPKTWTWQLMACLFIALLVGGAYSYERFPELWRHYFIPLIYLQWGVYIAFSIFSLIPVIKKWVRKETLKTYEKWVLAICGGVLIVFTCYVWSILNITKGSYISAALYFSFIMYVVIFILLYRKKTNDLSSFSVQKNGEKKLNEEEAQLMIGRLKKAMAEKELYRNPNLKINDLAKAINVSGHQLSHLLNNNIEKNFTLFINEYRIDEACKMLSNNTNLTIDAVGAEVGFNSKSTFFATFKKMKGMTPSVFQQSNTPNL